jgi:hypothetical protein
MTPWADTLPGLEDVQAGAFIPPAMEDEPPRRRHDDEKAGMSLGWNSGRLSRNDRISWSSVVTAGRYAAFFAVLLGAVLVPSFAMAAEQSDFMDRFTGQWSGGGPYKRTTRTPSVTIKCMLTGNRSGNRVQVGGTCRAAIVIKRTIAMDVTYDPASDSYRGTYKGEMDGLAQLSGKRKGDNVTFDVAWPEILNGDRTATMTIGSDGDGTMRLRMSDRASPDGPVQVMWDLTFRK